MRRLGDCRAFAGGFLQRQEAVGQHLELLLQPVYFLPLGGKLFRQFVDGFRLIGDSLFQFENTVVTHGVFHLVCGILAIRSCDA